MPRGMERFREYIKTMTDAETGDLALPLVAMNPMGKDHVPALIDEYLALGAEEIAERRGPRLPATSCDRRHCSAYGGSASYRVALVVSDDLKGGWTNRWASEYSHRIEGAAITKRGWLVGLLWTSEPASAHSVREAVLTSIYRAEYLHIARGAGHARRDAGPGRPRHVARRVHRRRSWMTTTLRIRDRSSTRCAARERSGHGDGLPVRRHGGQGARLSTARPHRSRRPGAGPEQRRAYRGHGETVIAALDSADARISLHRRSRQASSPARSSHQSRRAGRSGFSVTLPAEPGHAHRSMAGCSS